MTLFPPSSKFSNKNKIFYFIFTRTLSEKSEPRYHSIFATESRNNLGAKKGKLTIFELCGVSVNRKPYNLGESIRGLLKVIDNLMAKTMAASFRCICVTTSCKMSEVRLG